MAPAKLFDEMLQCRSVGDAGARLACYDRRVSAIGDAQAKNEVAVIDTESVRRTEREQFGLAARAVPALENPSVHAASDTLREIKSTIVGFEPASRNKWFLQLADGSKWETVEAIAYRVPQMNMAVTVKKAALGTFMVRPNGWPAVRARRIK